MPAFCRATSIFCLTDESSPLHAGVEGYKTEVWQMNDVASQQSEADRRLIQVIYGAVAVGVLAIGLYGFFNLVWLAGSAFSRQGLAIFSS